MKNYLTEQEFTKLFLGLLQSEGITKINRTELVKKLYFYYNLLPYSSLFYDIGLSLDYNKIDIKNSLYEEVLEGNIIINGEDIILHYKQLPDINNKNLLIPLKRLVKEFSLYLKIESLSAHPMNIYHKMSNGKYNVYKGENKSENVCWQLITDGDINKTYKTFHYRHNIVDNPLIVNSKINLNNILCHVVEVRNSSYTILKGMNDYCVGQIKIYTLSTNEDKLNELSNLANKYEDLKDISLIKKIAL